VRYWRRLTGERVRYAPFQEAAAEHPEVLGLLAHNPFPDHPPRYVRTLLYRYRFTTPAERTASGDCWTRELLRPYTPPSPLTNWTRP
jgi:hypothetical protein